MGNICGESVYSQVKQNPDFQKYLQMTEASKEVENKVNSVQKNVNTAALDLKNQNLSTVDSKQKQIQDHFQIVKQDIDKAYPGGVSFLESSKQAKLQDLLGVSAVNNQFTDIRTHINDQFAKEEQKVNEQFASIKDEELKKTKDQIPRVQILQHLNPSVKQNVTRAGLSEYKGIIEAKKKEVLAGLDGKLNGEGMIGRFKNLLPMDRLDNLTTISKQQISKNASNFVGSPGQGKATLY